MAKAPIIDASDPKAIASEIFDDDRWVKDEFAATFSADVLEFSEFLAQSFKHFGELDVLAKNSEQAAFVTGFIHGVFDDLLTSTKLLVTGKLMASGNLMRQAIEGIAAAILCSSRELVLISGKKKHVEVRYWQLVKRGDSRVSAHEALRHLQLNARALGLSVAAVEELNKARRRFNQFSHPGMMGMASRIALGEAGPIFLGGSFDESKVPAYRQEFEHRIGLCKTLPNLIINLVGNLKN